MTPPQTSTSPNPATVSKDIDTVSNSCSIGSTPAVERIKVLAKLGEETIKTNEIREAALSAFLREEFVKRIPQINEKDLDSAIAHLRIPPTENGGATFMTAINELNQIAGKDLLLLGSIARLAGLVDAGAELKVHAKSATELSGARARMADRWKTTVDTTDVANRAEAAADLKRVCGIAGSELGFTATDAGKTGPADQTEVERNLQRIRDLGVDLDRQNNSFKKVIGSQLQLEKLEKRLNELEYEEQERRNIQAERTKDA